MLVPGDGRSSCTCATTSGTKGRSSGPKVPSCSGRVR